MKPTEAYKQGQVLYTDDDQETTVKILGVVGEVHFLSEWNDYDSVDVPDGCLTRAQLDSGGYKRLDPRQEAQDRINKLNNEKSEAEKKLNQLEEELKEAAEDYEIALEQEKEKK